MYIWKHTNGIDVTHFYVSIYFYIYFYIFVSVHLYISTHLFLFQLKTFFPFASQFPPAGGHIPTDFWGVFGMLPWVICPGWGGAQSHCPEQRWAVTTWCCAQSLLPRGDPASLYFSNKRRNEVLGKVFVVGRSRAHGGEVRRTLSALCGPGAGCLPAPLRELDRSLKKKKSILSSHAPVGAKATSERLRDGWVDRIWLPEVERWQTPSWERGSSGPPRPNLLPGSGARRCIEPIYLFHGPKVPRGKKSC